MNGGLHSPFEPERVFDDPHMAGAATGASEAGAVADDNHHKNNYYNDNNENNHDNHNDNHNYNEGVGIGSSVGREHPEPLPCPPQHISPYYRANFPRSAPLPALSTALKGCLDRLALRTDCFDNPIEAFAPTSEGQCLIAVKVWLSDGGPNDGGPNDGGPNDEDEDRQAFLDDPERYRASRHTWP